MGPLLLFGDVPSELLWAVFEPRVALRLIPYASTIVVFLPAPNLEQVLRVARASEPPRSILVLSRKPRETRAQLRTRDLGIEVLGRPKSFAAVLTRLGFTAQ